MPLPTISSLLSLLLFLSPFTVSTTAPPSSSLSTSSYHENTLTFSVPSNLPPLLYSAHALLFTNGTTLSAPVTTRNTFIFYTADLVPTASRAFNPLSCHTKGSAPPPEPNPSSEWFVRVTDRDWKFMDYGLEVRRGKKKGKGKGEGGEDLGVELWVYRVAVGGARVGDKMKVEQGREVEVRVVGRNEYYEPRQGFNPLQLLKNPMVLIGVVGLAFVMGMPYLLENMDPETRREFEEQQKKGILGTGAGPSQANALQNFDMASWMAGRQQATASPGPKDKDNKDKDKDRDAQGKGQGSGREGGGGVKRRG